MNTFNEYFEYSLLESENDFNRYYLGTFINDLYEKQMLKIKKDFPFSVFLIALLPYIGRFLTLNQTCIIHTKQNNKKIPINCYGLGLLGSGKGKEALKNLMKNISEFYYNELKNTYEIRLIQLITEIQNSDLNVIQTKQAINDLKKEFKPVDICRDITRAGIRNMYETLSKFEKPTGGILVYIDEFSIFLQNLKNNSIKQDVMSALLEISELGQLEGTVLANEKYEEIMFLPVNMLMLTTPTILINKINDEFINILEQGWGRRLLFAYPEILDIEENDDLYINNPEKFLELNNAQIDFENLKILKNHINVLVQNSKIKTELFLTEECWNLNELYKRHCEKRANKIKDDDNEIIKIELLNRHWKALKIAGLFHTINTKLNSNIITVDSYRQAIYTIEYLGFHLKRFINNGSKADSEIIINIMKDKFLNKWITPRDIFLQIRRKIDLKYKTPTEFLKANLNMLELEAEVQGFVLTNEKTSKTIKYKLIVKPDNKL